MIESTSSTLPFLGSGGSGATDPVQVANPTGYYEDSVQARPYFDYDEAIAARIELFDHRVVEEFYDVVSDPDCLHNLIDSPEHQEALMNYRKTLEKTMTKSSDHALKAFQGRNDPDILKSYMEKVSAESAARRPKKNRGKGKAKKKKAP